MRTALYACVLLLAAVLSTGCGDTIVNNSPTSPSYPTTTDSKATAIEFRVNGNASLVRIRFSDPINGLTQVTTGLPYSAAIETTKSSLFLSLDVTPITYVSAAGISPFLSAQIFVNGIIFREASTSDFLTGMLVTGTWRK